VRRALARVGPVLAVDTGQHYDYALNALMYEQLGVAEADVLLEVGSAGHAEQTAAILMRAEQVLLQRRPAVAVVIGDTNSTVGCALAAVKLRIPVVHVEAGLIAADVMLPEEINRRVVDSVASVLCTPSPRETVRLAATRPDAMVVETGDVAYDVLLDQLDRLPPLEQVLPGFSSGGYHFATLHRAELTNRPAVLHAVLEALGGLDRPVVLALHPRTRAVLDEHPLPRSLGDRLSIIPPVGYHESLTLARNAALVLTDSGGVQREAYWLGTPCVTLREETEWIETVELGANVLVEPKAAGRELAAAALAQLERWSGPIRWSPLAYGNGRAGERIAAAVSRFLGYGD
jgi:UDP-GlcNAc3NAcA epimerase